MDRIIGKPDAPDPSRVLGGPYTGQILAGHGSDVMEEYALDTEHYRASPPWPGRRELAGIHLIRAFAQDDRSDWYSMRKTPSK